MEEYLATLKKKKKEALPFAIAWVYLKGIHFAK